MRKTSNDYYVIVLGRDKNILAILSSKALDVQLMCSWSARILLSGDLNG
jgi:hypothetical protein